MSGSDDAKDGPDQGGAEVEPTEGHDLEDLRQRILDLDEELVDRIAERREIVVQIGRIKNELGLPCWIQHREAAVVRRAASLAREKGVDEELVRDVIWRIMASARGDQTSSG